MSEEIRSFQIQTSDGELEDLKRRLRSTRWPDAETVGDWSQGTPLTYVKQVCDYWAHSYDWHKTEARLNALPQFRTEIDGLGIHFLHVRSEDASAMPLIMTHGWPRSIVEFLKAIPLLADPTAHGGEASDAFHVVCPSLPGYGFSDKPTNKGWTVEKIAGAWSELMVRLGYPSYYAQGGDWGSIVTTALAVQDTEHCRGIHLNMATVRPDPGANSLTEEEKDCLAALKHHQDWDSGYSKEQSTRPQTVGYGLADSPAGQAAWILEKFWAWTDCNGHPENVLTRDQMLDDIMMYWLPGTAASAARLYWESLGKTSQDPVRIPVGYSVFPKEIFRVSRRWAEKRYLNLVLLEPTGSGRSLRGFRAAQALRRGATGLFSQDADPKWVKSERRHDGDPKGVIFSLLMITSLGILRLAVPADLTRLDIWLSDPGHRHTVSLALNLAPFSGIAFLWLLGVLRNRLGASEDQFFATVFFGSGLLFVASVFASAAAAGAFVEAAEAGSIQPTNGEIYYFVRRLSYIFMNTFGIKMAGVFMFPTCTIVLRTGMLPRWVAFLGFACGLVLLVIITNWEWIALLFPSWILIVSGQILISDLRKRRSVSPTT